MDLLEILGIDEHEEKGGNMISFERYKLFGRNDSDELLGQLLENAYNELKGEHQLVMTRLRDETGVIKADGEPDMRALMNYVCELYNSYNIDVIKAFFDYLLKNKYVEAKDKFLYGFNLFELRIIILLTELFASKNLTGYFYAYRKFDYIFNELLASSYHDDVAEFKAVIKEYKEYKNNPFYPQARPHKAAEKLNNSHNARLEKMAGEVNAMKKRLNKPQSLSILNMITDDFEDWKDAYKNYV